LKNIQVDYLNLKGESTIDKVRLLEDMKLKEILMDFMPGGDLSRIIKSDDSLSERASRFYCAEMILGVEEIHRRG
jgi:serine/threonine protein kinase